MLKIATGRTGRPKENWVLELLKYLEEENKSVCLVVKHNREECGRYLVENFQPKICRDGKK